MKAEIKIEWPFLLVKGKKVTKKQACEILIRTSRWPLTSRNNLADNLYNGMLGLNRDTHYQSASYREAKYKYKILDLEHLHNHRITSSYSNMLHGWCDWDGNIQANSYRVGKFPSICGIQKELILIAESFPYLDMDMQFLDDTDQKFDVTAQWKVQDGLARLVEISDRILEPDESKDESSLKEMINCRAEPSDVMLGISTILESHS